VNEPPLFQEIAENIRSEILHGLRAPGDELPSVRELAQQLGCAPGTVQRAYNELARQGLVVGRQGQGTRVVDKPAIEPQYPLRRAKLSHEVESFLLGSIQSGYSPEEIEEAFSLVLDRWRSMASSSRLPKNRTGPGNLRFVGSHDPLIPWLSELLHHQRPSYRLELAFNGSLGGLIALAQGEADLAGCHLWDPQTDTYNLPYVQRLLPGKKIALIRLVNRRLGLLTAPGNPLNIKCLADLSSRKVLFINRQSGAGTRVWLDAQLQRINLAPNQIKGYTIEALTHTDIAQAISNDRANVGLGIETAALVYGLGFVPLQMEFYDLVVPASVLESEPLQTLIKLLRVEETHNMINARGGYDTSETGSIVWTQ